MEIAIHRARPEQADRLTEIAHAAKRHWGYSEIDIGRWRDELTLTPEFIERHTVFTATANGEPVGLCALVDNGDRMELEHFWVDPVCIGRGVGRALVLRALEEAAARGAIAIDLSADPYAERFYLRMGARRTGEVSAPIEGEWSRVLPRLTFDLETEDGER